MPRGRGGRTTAAASNRIQPIVTETENDQESPILRGIRLNRSRSVSLESNNQMNNSLEHYRRYSPVIREGSHTPRRNASRSRSPGRHHSRYHSSGQYNSRPAGSVPQRSHSPRHTASRSRSPGRHQSRYHSSGQYNSRPAGSVPQRSHSPRHTASRSRSPGRHHSRYHSSSQYNSRPAGSVPQRSHSPRHTASRSRSPGRHQSRYHSSGQYNSRPAGSVPQRSHSPRHTASRSRSPGRHQSRYHSSGQYNSRPAGSVPQRSHSPRHTASRSRSPGRHHSRYHSSGQYNSRPAGSVQQRSHSPRHTASRSRSPRRQSLDPDLLECPLRELIVKTPSRSLRIRSETRIQAGRNPTVDRFTFGCESQEQGGISKWTGLKIPEIGHYTIFNFAFVDSDVSANHQIVRLIRDLYGIQLPADNVTVADSRKRSGMIDGYSSVQFEVSRSEVSHLENIFESHFYHERCRKRNRRLYGANTEKYKYLVQGRQNDGLSLCAWMYLVTDELYSAFPHMEFMAGTRSLLLKTEKGPELEVGMAFVMKDKEFRIRGARAFWRLNRTGRGCVLNIAKAQQIDKKMFDE